MRIRYLVLVVFPLIAVGVFVVMGRVAPKVISRQETSKPGSLSEQDILKAVESAGYTGLISKDGEGGVSGQVGVVGDQGPAGLDGADGSPASDDQTLSFDNSLYLLSLTGGNNVSLASLKDNTDILAGLSCMIGQVSGWNGSAWVCLSAAADTDDQTLSLIGDTLAIDGGNSVSLNVYLDNTDAQAISLGGNIISISGNSSSINLAQFLDNTDAQTVTYTPGTQILSISGGNTAILSSLLDNTDAQAISRTGDTLSITGNSSTVSLSSYLDNTDNQAISRSGNTISITGNAATIDLSSYLDNTDVLASLSCISGQVAQWSGSAWVCASAAINTDNQTLTYTSGTQTLSIAGGNSVALSTLLDNTDILASLACSTGQIPKWNGSVWACNNDNVNDADANASNELQDLSITTNILSLSSSAQTISLTPYLDNTDAQTLSLVGSSLSLVNGGSVSLASFVDTYTAGNGLTLATNSFSISSPTCSGTTKLQWNGTAFICTADVDTTYSAGTGLGLSGSTFNLSNTAVTPGTYNNVSVDQQGRTTAASNAAYLTAETDGEIGNEVLNATTSKGLARSGAGTSANPYTLGLVNCADTQILKYINGSSTWGCAADNTSAVSANSLNYTEFANILSLDATTTTNLGVYNHITNLDSTGDFIIQDNGTTVLSVLNNGTFEFKNSINSTTGFTIQSAGGTNLFVIDSINSRVYVGNPTADSTGALLVLDSKNTVGDPAGVNGGQYYNSALNKFRCYQNGAWEDCVSRSRVTLAADVVNSNAVANTIADVTGLSFPVILNTDYSFECIIWYTSAITTTGSRWTINGPATTSLAYGSTYSFTATTNTFNNLTTYNTPAAANTTSAAVAGNTATIKGFIRPSASGSVNVRFASEIASSAITAKAGSSCEYWSL